MRTLLRSYLVQQLITPPLALAFLVTLRPVETAGAELTPVYNQTEYATIMADEVLGIDDLQSWVNALKDDILPILPPIAGMSMTQEGNTEVLPFQAVHFPAAFVAGLAGVYENSVPVYPITVVENPETHALTFYNFDLEPFYTMNAATGYDPFSYLKDRWPDLYGGGANPASRAYYEGIYNPARVVARTKLIESDNLPF